MRTIKAVMMPHILEKKKKKKKKKYYLVPRKQLGTLVKLNQTLAGRKEISHFYSHTRRVKICFIVLIQRVQRIFGVHRRRRVYLKRSKNLSPSAVRHGPLSSALAVRRPPSAFPPSALHFSWHCPCPTSNLGPILSYKVGSILCRC